MEKSYLKWSPGFFAILLIPFLLLLFTEMAQAQNKRYTISGKVTDAANNSPVPGAVVKIINTNLVTSTSSSGTYSFSVDLAPGKYQIQISFIGFKSNIETVTLGDNTTVQANSALSGDAVGLDEVIVTGTSQGTTRKQLGSYVSTVKGDDLNKAPSGNALASLQGKTPGAQISQNSGDPAGGISVRLRGVSSVNSSSEPLYIIDGVIVNNSTTRVTNTSANYDGGNFVGSIGQNRMVDISPADIDHIEVLNGAAAAAIYGSRANAGVIQIFTKRGKTGEPQVSFSTSLTISELRKQIEVNQAPFRFGDNANSVTQDVIQTVPPTPGATPVLQTAKTPVTRYNYQDYIFRTGIGTDNSVSVSGGNDNTKFYTSAGYFSNQGIIKNTDFKRMNFRANLDQKINNWAKMTAGFNYVHSDANEKPDGNSFFSPMNSVTIIGNFHDIFATDILGNLKAVGERGRVNPVSVIEDIKQRQFTNRIIANLGLKLNPVKNLTIDYTMGVDNSIQNGTTFIPPFTYNVSTGFYGGGASLDPSLNGYASAANATTTLFNNELNFTYDAKISDLLSSTTQLGGSYQYQKDLFSLLNGRGLAPLIQTVNGASTILPNNDNRSEFSISGAYLQQNFKYKDHLFVTGAIRVDQSTVFGEGNGTQFYPKANVSYVLSSANYWKDLGVSSWWNAFKLRAAYGESGNLTGIGAYDRFNVYLPSALNSKTSLASSSTLANTDVKPERQKELELGTDMSFFNNRLGLTFSWYNKSVKDLLLGVVIAPTTGYSSLLDNIGGSLKNKGIELMLTGVPLKTQDFTWTSTLIYNRNRNKIVGSGAQRLISTNAGAPVSITDGYPVGVFYGTYFERTASGDIATNPAGIPLTAGQAAGNVLRKVIGDPNPDYTGSFVNDFTYKKLSLHIQLDAVQGGDVWNADWRTRQGVGNGKVAEAEQLGQLPRGYVAGAYNVEEWRIDDGSFVKLREISLSYNIGQVKFIKNLTVNLSGRNLISWDNYKGYDPELNSGGQSTILRNIDFGSVPIPRTFSFGLQAKF
ncbi:SusC/RagA family TonB-linked outer membrane protein [Pedobacter sp. ISL-68]|uniref:SusC/RagA family TonB-linked outer membrane protein n=1 Tax=unclassified Pedobacter TaxID=2628915 RepID=UPI001BE67D63|nr:MULTISPECIES: SusC/RagA family TonB-linked outer membrane protein [unclassified Pedobacter]MBT2563322.1 SusC/RagA family TonB-linked outer membrane protein [Pedobacter sp. ISL-64]MBT2588637.1 SusC/RagA family TonB-linked outer membrane protein [Pedobacter sp. ISL-68]